MNNTPYNNRSSISFESGNPTPYCFVKRIVAEIIISKGKKDPSYLVDHSIAPCIIKIIYKNVYCTIAFLLTFISYSPLLCTDSNTIESSHFSPNEYFQCFQSHFSVYYLQNTLVWIHTLYHIVLLLQEFHQFPE